MPAAVPPGLPASSPLLALVDVRARQAALRSEQDDLVLRARSAGLSWRLIGAAVGTSAQAVQQRATRAATA